MPPVQDVADTARTFYLAQYTSQRTGKIVDVATVQGARETVSAKIVVVWR